MTTKPNCPVLAFGKNTDYRNGHYSFIFLKFFIFLFILSTLFDPADKVFGLKLPLFLTAWVLGISGILLHIKSTKISINLLIYVLLMIVIPSISVGVYLITDGSKPFAGLLLIKSYLFLSFAILIYITKINVLKYLSFALTLLAISILMLTVFVLIFPEMYITTYQFGEQFDIYSIDQGRDYGSGQTFFQMYFVTSSMLVISIAYYYDLWHSSKHKKPIYLVLVVINVFAMFIAGTRNNMIIAIILPLTLVILYSKHKLRNIFIIFVLIGLFVIIWQDNILALFDPNELSNHTKLTMLGDYYKIFSDYSTLLFGQGLGSYEYWTGRGYNFVTELTYLEIIRNFGIFMGGVMIMLLLYPIIYAFILNPSYNKKNIILAYAAYLVMSMTNPLFFSSMGMLILAIVISDTFTYDLDIKRYRLLTDLTYKRL